MLLLLLIQKWLNTLNYGILVALQGYVGLFAKWFGRPECTACALTLPDSVISRFSHTCSCDDGVLVLRCRFGQFTILVSSLTRCTGWVVRSTWTSTKSYNQFTSPYTFWSYNRSDITLKGSDSDPNRKKCSSVDYPSELYDVTSSVLDDTRRIFFCKSAASAADAKRVQKHEAQPGATAGNSAVEQKSNKVVRSWKRWWSYWAATGKAGGTWGSVESSWSL